MRFFLLAVVMSLLHSCSKPVDTVMPPVINPVPPAMEYSNLGDIPAGKGHTVVLDPDKNGATDILFAYQVTNDGSLNADKHQFYVSAMRNIFLPFDAVEEAPVLVKGAVIAAGSFPAYNWYHGSVTLAEKVVTNTQLPYWQGKWKNAGHAFLPIRFSKVQGQHFGWIELSFDTQTELLTLHRMAISAQPDVLVYAGY